jgi:hypothetical protein
MPRGSGVACAELRPLVAVRADSITSCHASPLFVMLGCNVLFDILRHKPPPLNSVFDMPAEEVVIKRHPLNRRVFATAGPPFQIMVLVDTAISGNQSEPVVPMQPPLAALALPSLGIAPVWIWIRV